MSDNTNMTGAAAAGGGGGAAAVVPAATQASTSVFDDAWTKYLLDVATKFGNQLNFILVGHGEDWYSCTSTKVPQNTNIGFPYNPALGSTIVCMEPTRIPTICKTLPKLIYSSDQSYTNLTLTPATEMGYPSMLYLCNTGVWLSPNFLFDIQASTKVPAICLSSCVNALRTNFGTHIELNITVIACGQLSKSKIHPSRVTVTFPGTKYFNTTLNKYMMSLQKGGTRKIRSKVRRRKRVHSRRKN
jgi:hypothetical protein